MRTFFIILLSICCFSVKSQTNSNQYTIDSILAKKITVSGFCLCKTTLTDLKSIDSALKEVDVEEMDLCNDGFTQDARFVNQKGYSSKKYPGIIFQKDDDNDYISKIRLTKDFVGNLPDGTPINMNTLLAKEVVSFYPSFNTWQSRGCSNYWNITNDTLSFFVKIDKKKQPQYPIDETYYLNKPVEGIDIVMSCSSLNNSSDKFQLFSPTEPMFFLDSIRINEGVLETYKPDEIALISVYKDSNATKIAGVLAKKGVVYAAEQAKNGVIFITTKSFARKSYWNYFKLKSLEYQKVVTDMKTEKNVVYILNGKVLNSNYEGDLFSINDNNFISLMMIDKSKLKKEYNISNKSIGIVINSIRELNAPDTKVRGNPNP